MGRDVRKHCHHLLETLLGKAGVALKLLHGQLRLVSSLHFFAVGGLALQTQAVLKLLRTAESVELQELYRQPNLSILTEGLYGKADLLRILKTPQRNPRQSGKQERTQKT